MSLSEVRFSLPPGVTDQTVYAFVFGEEDTPEREKLTFDCGAIPDGVRDLDGLVQYRLGSLRVPGQVSVNIVEDVASQFGLTPARLLNIELSSASAAIRRLCLLAIPSAQMYVQLTYAAPDIRDAVSRLDRIARSAQAADLKVGPADPGFVRRSIGMATIEVPSNLKPPSQYVFDLPDSLSTMEMTVWWPGDPEPPRRLAQLVSDDAALAERVSAATPESTQSRGGYARFVRYTLAKKLFDDVEWLAVWRARIRLIGGAIASVSACAVESSKDRVDAAFLAFVQSVREE